MKTKITSKELVAPVFNIQRFCIHDGPGIRTTVFLKGCNLACYWCHNPESRQAEPQLMFYTDRCLGCAACVAVCRTGARRKDGSRIVFSPEVCQSCFACVAACPTGALERCGQQMTVAEVFEEVVRDKPFYETSGGGVTVSGGEPLLYPDFVRSLFLCLKQEKITTAIETAGAVSWKNIKTVLPVTDLFLYDLKSAGEKLFRKATGGQLHLVLENLTELLDARTRLIIRIPVVPGFNDSPSQRDLMVKLLKKLPGRFAVEPLKYHQMAQGKYRALSLPAPRQEISARQAEAAYRETVAAFRKAGLPVLSV